MAGLERRLLSSYIKKMAHLLAQIIQMKAEPYGLTNAQLNILLCLMNGAPVTQKELLQYLDVKSSTLTVLLDHLEAKGLIMKQAHPDDSRAKILHLTSKGKQFMKDTVLPLAGELEKDLLKGFNAEEQMRLFDDLERVLANLKWIKKQA
jgi:DNA-binding MarR family transcriptional regulator